MNRTRRFPIDQWGKELSMFLHKGAPLKRAIVVREATSTQDAARQMQCSLGDVVIAGRQTNGRGRLGRVWIDTRAQGVAMTLVVKRDLPERLAIMSGIGTALAIENACKGSDVAVCIKWPNDVMANGRKIAGILVEQFDDRALVGIGINVLQRRWPKGLEGRAISLKQLGVDKQRLSVMVGVVLMMQTTLNWNDAALIDEFRKRDALVGSHAAFRIGEREIRGKVLRVDPMKGLAVLTENEGEVWLPAATTTVIKE